MLMCWVAVQFVSSRPGSPVTFKGSADGLDTIAGLAELKLNGGLESGPDAVAVLEAKASGF